MTAARLDKLLRATAQQVDRGENYWEFTSGGVRMACVIDTRYDRMRIIAPIARVEEINAGQKDKMLEANFHSALDARYATSAGVVYAAFIHPLSLLQDAEFQSALRQVAEAARTFGTTYSSGELVYGQPKGN